MRLCRAAFSRPILAIATTLSAGFAAPAMAQFAPGVHFFAPPEGSGWNRGPALSDDGTTLAGEIYDFAAQTTQGYTLQSDGVIRPLVGMPRVYDVSDNGAYTVGYSTRRAADGTTLTLLNNTQPADSTIGAKISGDGQIVAGTAEETFGGQPIFASSPWRWSATSGLTHLGAYRPNSFITNVLDISRDGSTIVGTGSDAVFGSRTEAWMWREGQGYTVLPDAPGSRWVEAEARGANADGTIIVGKGNDAIGNIHALVWHNGVPTALPATGSFRNVTANGLSDDGSLIVGTLADSNAGLATTAAIWTPGGDWVPALDFLRGQGLEIPIGFRATRIQVSGDGTTFSALVRDGQASTSLLMVAVVPSPASLALLGVFWLTRRRARARS